MAGHDATTLSDNIWNMVFAKICAADARSAVKFKALRQLQKTIDVTLADRTAIEDRDALSRDACVEAQAEVARAIAAVEVLAQSLQAGLQLAQTATGGVDVSALHGRLNHVSAQLNTLAKTLSERVPDIVSRTAEIAADVDPDNNIPF